MMRKEEEGKGKRREKAIGEVFLFNLSFVLFLLNSAFDSPAPSGPTVEPNRPIGDNQGGRVPPEGTEFTVAARNPVDGRSVYRRRRRFSRNPWWKPRSSTISPSWSAPARPTRKPWRNSPPTPMPSCCFTTFHCSARRRSATPRSARSSWRIAAGVGYNNVDLNAANRHGVIVCNVPDYGPEEVADHALMFLLAIARG